jgi:hypothetical protein
MIFYLSIWIFLNFFGSLLVLAPIMATFLVWFFIKKKIFNDQLPNQSPACFLNNAEVESQKSAVNNLTIVNQNRVAKNQQTNLGNLEEYSSRDLETNLNEDRMKYLPIGAPKKEVFLKLGKNKPKPNTVFHHCFIDYQIDCSNILKL